MSHTHSLAEWGAALLFGCLSWLACSLLVVSLLALLFPADGGTR